MWNETSGEQDVACGRNVVAGFVPEVGEAKQGQMQQKNKDKDDREYQCRVRARPLRARALARLENFQNEAPALVCRARMYRR